MQRQTISSWAHLKAILRHVGLAYSTPMPRRILILLVLTTLSFWCVAYWQYSNWAAQQDSLQNQQLTFQILSQFQRYETILLGCNSFFNASENVTKDEWEQYVSGLNIRENYGALTDIAVLRYQQIPVLDQNSPDNWMATVDKRFSFNSKHEGDITRFDTSDLIRHKLLESAKDNKIVCLSSISAWLCTTKSTTLLLPLFKSTGENENTPLASMQNLYGWIAIAMDLDMLLKINKETSNWQEEITLTHVDKDLLVNDHISLENLQKNMNSRNSQSTHHLAGGVWAIHITNHRTAQSKIVLLLLAGILLAGLTISLLISGLLGASISSHQHAMQIIAIKSKALFESEKRTREILDSANEAFFSCNFTGHIIDWSKQSQKLFGYSKDQIIGRTLTQTILPNTELHDATHGGLRQILTATESGQRFELTARHADGKQFPVELSISPMHTSDGFVFNAFIHDITARKALQTQLSHAQKLESIGELAAGIAHEINTPTQYVGDNTRFLKDAFAELDQVQTAIIQYVNSFDAKTKPDTPQFKQLTDTLSSLDMEFLHEEIPTAIEQTLDGINRVAEIVRSMKNFAHPGTENKQLSDLNQAIKSTTVVCRNVWKYVSDLTLELADDLPLVNCTPGEINQVILNLIVNAAHAIEDKQKATGDETKGTITIRTRHDKDTVCIEVMDTGNGIPQSIRERIYDPFTTTKQVGRGTGQGLAIAHTVIVDKHQGKISFTTQEGVGTTFTIVLPIDGDMTSQVVHEYEIEDAKRQTPKCKTERKNG